MSICGSGGNDERKVNEIVMMSVYTGNPIISSM
jgi:hypothetical protein